MVSLWYARFSPLSMDFSVASPKVSLTKNEKLNQTHVNNYKEIISTLPRQKGWTAGNNSNVDFFHYQGFWCFASFLEGVMSAQELFNPRPTDIFITSYPKTGTTWLKALTFAIVTRDCFNDSTNPLLSKVPHDCIPFLEVDLAIDSNNRQLEIPLVATHVPYSSLPKSVIDSGCKIVYISRDPKDTFVSMYYFIAKQQLSKGFETLPLQTAFDLFCKGVANYGPYWDHVLGYWKASLNFPDKILFLKYEDMKKETVFYVKKLAEFIGYPFTLEEEAKGVVQKIIDLCSFQNLSNLEVNRSGKHRNGTTLAISNNAYFRKGNVGDWKNELIPEMGARLDMIIEEKLSGSGLTLMSPMPK